MNLRHSAVVSLMVIVAVGCGSGASKPAKTTKPFLDLKQEVDSRLEWNKEVTAKSEGTISFRVTSQGPFTVTIVNEKGYKALAGGDKKALDKADILLMVDSNESSYEGKVTIPAGSSYFIIQNRTDKKAELHLQCFPPG